jgi:hypothetical protein
MISQPTDPTTPIKQSLQWWKYLLVAATVTVFLGFIFWQPITRIFSHPDPCLTMECYPTGPSASWQELFSAADGAARKIDPDALLKVVDASPAAYVFTTWHDNDALRVTFNYILTDGTSLDVELLDTSPLTVTTSQLNGNPRTYQEYAQHRSEIEAAVTRVVLTPRQAIESTLVEARTMSQAKGQDVRPHSHFYPFPSASYADYVTSQNWYANYSLLTNGKYDLDNILLWPVFAVDASSGAVKNVTRTEAPPTPTP